MDTMPSLERYRRDMEAAIENAARRAAEMDAIPEAVLCDECQIFRTVNTGRTCGLCCRFPLWQAATAADEIRTAAAATPASCPNPVSRRQIERGAARKRIAKSARPACQLIPVRAQSATLREPEASMDRLDARSRPEDGRETPDQRTPSTEAGPLPAQPDAAAPATQPRGGNVAYREDTPPADHRLSTPTTAAAAQSTPHEPLSTLLPESPHGQYYQKL